MTTIALIDARVELNAVDLSTRAKSVKLTGEVEALENTGFGQGGGRGRQGGLKDFTVEIEWNQDFAAGSVDATLWAAFGTLVTIKVRPTSAAISATNPEYVGTVLIDQYPPFGNGVGELATVSTTWPGSGLLARNTA